MASPRQSIHLNHEYIVDDSPFLPQGHLPIFSGASWCFCCFFHAGQQHSSSTSRLSPLAFFLLTRVSCMPFCGANPRETVQEFAHAMGKGQASWSAQAISFFIGTGPHGGHRSTMAMPSICTPESLSWGLLLPYTAASEPRQNEEA